MPKGHRVIKTGTYRKRRRDMRTRRIRREAVYWVVAAVLALAVAWGVSTVGIAAWHGAATWWKTHTAVTRRTDDQNKPVSLVVIGIDSQKSRKTATDLALVQIVPKEGKVRGISFPGNTFVEVPGQGFERAAEALRAGPDVAMATVQNLFGVAVQRYLILDAADYQSLAQQGNAGALFAHPAATDIPTDMYNRLAEVARSVKAGDALIVPLPLKTISIEEDLYYEAQTDKVADVLKAWWGVVETPQTQPLRIKILNGSGVPGIGGEAAKPLIKAGYRVVDTTNANTFNYKHTLIVMYKNDPQDAERIRQALGVGTIVHGTMVQTVLDVEIVIGRDFKPPKG